MSGEWLLFPDLMMRCLAAGDSSSFISDTVVTTVELLVLACGVGVVTRFIKVPYTIALVLVGLAIAIVGWAPEGAVITHDLVLLLFLPPLLFQAGLHLDLAQLRRVWLPVLIFALPGVVVTALAVALAVRLVMPEALGPIADDLASRLGEPGNREMALWVIALLTGIVVAPTDPISVMAVFKTAGVPEKLKTIVEGESLFNDGTAVGIFAVLAATITAALSAAGGDGAAHADSIAVVPIALNFLRVALLGTGIGLACGFVVFLVLRIVHDHTLETAMTIALAWGSFLLAEKLHASGVIAVVVAALIIGNYGRVLHMREDVVQTLHGFWDSTDFVINSLLFLLIGFELSDPAVGGWRTLLEPQVYLTALAVLGAVLAARALLVYPLSMLLGRHWPRGWKHIIWWAGLKGSLTLALILVLPQGPLREFLVPIAFLIVLISLIGQGATMPLLIKAVEMGDADEEAHEDDEAMPSAPTH